MNPTTAPQRFQSADVLADAIIERVGGKIVLALPLGVGKANCIANALFARAAADRRVKLHIFTALTLERPRANQELERRFVGPLNERLFKGYPELAYVAAQRSGRMPANIQINEFFFQAGNWLGNGPAQQNYISANYTHALRYVLDIGVNVIAQLVAVRKAASGDSFSIASNPDLTADLLALRRAGKTNFLFAGEINSEMPFMTHDAEVSLEEFDCLLEGHENDYPLFAPPREPIALADYAAGIHAARAVVDGGTLQIGIGSSGDAVAKVLSLRHQNNAEFQNLLTVLRVRDVAPPLDNKGPFSAGLYGCTEMFVEGMLDLYQAGVLKREVDGAVLHAAFFLGSRKFYQTLAALSETQRDKFRMTAVSYVNELYGQEEEKRAARVDARFINDAMIATLLGAVVSDGLDNGQVVSGVGGQYNFVSQGFALDGARSIIMLRSQRIVKGRVQSNIRWSYGHTTIPRHLRDIIVTEYGTADLRGKSDREVISAMLSITDAQFQDGLLEQAKAAGKIEREFRIPSAWRNNTLGFIENALRPAQNAGLLPPFPFGTDFTEVEQQLLPALKSLKTASLRRLAYLLLSGLRSDGDYANCLMRMSLAKPANLKEQLYAALVRGALRENSIGDAAVLTKPR